MSDAALTWRLYVCVHGDDAWSFVAAFADLPAVARRIARLEGLSVPELAFSVQVPLNDAGDGAILTHFQMQGRTSLYVIAQDDEPDGDGRQA